MNGSMQGWGFVDVEGLAGFEGLGGGWVLSGSWACLLVAAHTALDTTSFTKIITT